MCNFVAKFATVEGHSIEYKGKTLVMGDDLPFEDFDRFIFKFEKTNSEWIQGFEIYLFGFIEIEDLNEIVRDRTVFWENTAPQQVIIKVWRDSTKRKKPKSLPEKGLLGIKNIWDPGMGSIESWYGGAAMIVEEIENGRRYYCNDGHLDENFDDIVFTVQKIKS